MATTFGSEKSFSFTHVNLAQAWPNYRFVMQNCSSLIYGFSQQNPWCSFCYPTAATQMFIFLQFYWNSFFLEFNPLLFEFPSFQIQLLKLHKRKTASEASRSRDARRSMSKEKVALLQKTFSLRARASIDDCPIKNGSCTVFENHFKKSHYYTLQAKRTTLKLHLENIWIFVQKEKRK